MGEISRRTWWAVALVVSAIVLAAVVVQAGTLGFWEPWESTVVRADVAGEAESREVADGETDETDETDETADPEKTGDPSRAVPTIEGRPVEISWLRAWWTSVAVDDDPVVEAGGIGELERRARLPLIALAVLLIGAGAWWTRRHLGDGPAAMTVVVLATSPIAVLGALMLSGPFVAIAASALAVTALFQSAYGRGRRVSWAVAGAAALAVVALDQRWIGVVSTVAVAVCLAVVEAVDETDDDGRTELKVGWAVGAAVAFAGLIGWGLVESWDFQEGLFRPDVLQIVWIAGPVVLLGGLAAAARTSTAGRALVGLRGLLFVAGGLAPLAVLAAAHPGVADPEAAEAGVPALAHLIEYHQVAGEVAAQGDFSWWWRQLGFGLFPHLMFVLPAVGYLIWRLSPEADSTDRERAVARLCLVWPVAVYLVVAPAAGLGYTSYPALFPFALAIGWMVSDGEFWSSLRLRPALYLLVAIVALFTVAILTNDLRDFPQRLVDFVLQGADEPGVPDRFVEQTAVGTWGGVMTGAIVLYFAGAVSWLVFAWRDLKRLWRWLVELGGRLLEWWRHRGEDDGAAGSDPGEADSGDASDGGSDGRLAGDRRMAAREEWRETDHFAARVARRVERLPGLIGLVVVGGLGFVGVLLGSVVPQLDGELSSRAVVETYLETAEDGRKLWRYQAEEDADHFYVRGLPEISGRRDFNRRYGGEERFFALIPEDELAEVHSRVRRNHGENMPVLAIGGGRVLLSNRLLEGETDVNPISDYVLDEPDGDYVSLETEVDGRSRHPEFDDRITFLGYSLDRGGPDERPVYSWGDTIEMTQYFRVERRIPRSYEIFVHIDLGGNRIHGDHDPVEGLYPTNRWREGDIVKNVHEIEIQRFVVPGVYDFYTGFYSDDDRMSVEPDEAHDGDDRVELTEIEIVPF